MSPRNVFFDICIGWLQIGVELAALVIIKTRIESSACLTCGQTWFAVIGPDTPALGEMKNDEQYYQKQIAKTVAAFLGVEYYNVKPVGQAIESMINSKPQVIERLANDANLHDRQPEK